MSPGNDRRHVVILREGFAGLGCAQKLADHQDVRITLLDRNNYHQFCSHSPREGGAWWRLSRQRGIRPLFPGAAPRSRQSHTMRLCWAGLAHAVRLRAEGVDASAPVG